MGGAVIMKFTNTETLEMAPSPLYKYVECEYSQYRDGARNIRDTEEFEKGINIALIKFCIYDKKNKKALPAYDEKKNNYNYRLKVYDFEKREIGYMILFWEEYKKLIEIWDM